MGLNETHVGRRMLEVGRGMTHIREGKKSFPTKFDMGDMEGLIPGPFCPPSLFKKGFLKKICHKEYFAGT